MKENLLKKSEEQNLQICDFSIKNIYIDRLDDKVEKVSNKYQKIVKKNVLKRMTVPWTHVIRDLSGVENASTFYEKDLQNTTQIEFRIENKIKKKSEKLYLYVKWKMYERLWQFV